MSALTIRCILDLTGKDTRDVRVSEVERLDSILILNEYLTSPNADYGIMLTPLFIRSGIIIDMTSQKPV